METEAARRRETSRPQKRDNCAAAARLCGAASASPCARGARYFQPSFAFLRRVSEPSASLAVQLGWSFPAARFPGSEAGEAQAPVVILVSLVRGCEALREMLCLFPSGCCSSRALSTQPRPFLVFLSGLPVAVGFSQR